jgi:hypothetical protein
MNKNKSLFREFIDFLLITKKWWLVPLLIALLILGYLIIFSAALPISPFIYSF